MMMRPSLSLLAAVFWLGALATGGIVSAGDLKVPVAKSKASKAEKAAYQPQVGDMLFQSLPPNPLSNAIQGVTQSELSHCGVVVQREGKWYVAEAIGPVRYNPLQKWISQGRGGKFLAYRLKPEQRDQITAFTEALDKYMGRPYDIRYQMDDRKIYCSELIYKAYRDATGIELAGLDALGDLNWRPHEAFIRSLEKGGLPLERKMITPVALTRSTYLERIY